jgi:dUTP pyrophosphatase
MKTEYNFTFVPITKTHPDAVVPTQKPGDVGFDVSSVERIEIMPGCTQKVATGLKIADAIVTPNQNQQVQFLKVEGRSGLASRGVFPVGGIIDPDYRGEIGIILHNSSKDTFVINKGDRIAQLVCYIVLATSTFNKVRFTVADSVSKTDRGEKGFGSSGM